MILKNLRTPGALDELKQRIAALPCDARPQWGRMSVGGMICHLSDSYLSILAQRESTRYTKGLKGRFVKLFAVYVPLPWPKGVPTMPEVEQGKGGTAPCDFDTDRDKLLRLLDRFAAQSNLERRSHPIFGSMKEVEWHRWAYLHADHHLRQFGV